MRARSRATPSPACSSATSIPSGKLPLTFPIDEARTPLTTPEQYPGVDGVLSYSEGILVGYRGYDQLDLEPRFAFGHGLSYTAFAYDGLELEPRPIDDDASATAVIEVSFDLTNTGARAGTEVAQVYLGRLPADVATPPRTLAGWARVTLDPGERRRVTVAIPRRSLEWWDVARRGWTLARGSVDVEVGASSRDIRLRGRTTV